MEENQVNPVVTEQPTATEPAVQTDPTSQPSGEQKPDRTFTRDEVTRILKRRIDRYQNQVFTKYGVKDSTELDSLFEKARGYDDIVKNRDELSEKVAFMENNVDPDRYDDVRTYFKGLGKTFDSSSLAEMIKTHPEWVKKMISEAKTTTVKPLGTDISRKPAKSERDYARELFGVDL